MMMVRNKKIVTCFLLCLLVASISGLSFASLTQAVLYQLPHPNPITDKPIISLLSPNQGILFQNDTKIVFRVDMPQSWDWNYSGGSRFVGAIESATCLIDQRQVYSNNIGYGNAATEQNSTHDYPNFYVRSIQYEASINSLTLGQHNLTILVKGYTLFFNGSYENFPSSAWLQGQHYNFTATETYVFAVTPYPTITPINPSPSLTLFPTPSLEPTSTIIPTDNFETFYLFPISGVIILLVIVGLVVYFRKIRK
jgi:hypothetical protein